MNTVSGIINQLNNSSVRVYTQGDQLKVDIPWPIGSVPEPIRYYLREIKNRQAEVLAYFDPGQEKYWQAVLTNAYFLHYPAGVPLRPLYLELSNLKYQGAYLVRANENGVPGLQLGLPAGLPAPHYPEQLRWLLSLSVLGVARDYVDLAVDFPEEWIDDTLGKHGARIAKLRAEIIEAMIEQGKENGVCFKAGKEWVYCLMPCKTGRAMTELAKTGLHVTELTPEEVVLVSEAQAAGMLTPGPDGARAALKWGEAGDSRKELHL